MSKDDAFRPKARRPRGLIDRRGPQLAAERDLVAKISRVYEAWGFEPLETSAFEYADALGKFLPDQDRPNEGVFSLLDDDEQWLSLRYDLTAPLARFVAENYDALPKPYRRWAAGPVWRNEKPGPGRFREFWQCDADTVGAASPAADAEMIAMACAALEAAGLSRDQYVVNYSSRRVLDALLQAIGVGEGDHAVRLIVLRAIDKLDRLGAAGVRDLLGGGRKDESGDFTKGAGLDQAQIEVILNFFAADDQAAVMNASFDMLSGNGAFEELTLIGGVLKSLGASGNAALDFSIVRGLEYYTGAVFEAQLISGDGASFGSIGGGGRYDDLVSRFKGQAIPATGFSVGVSRLAAALQQMAQTQADGPIVVLPFDPEGMADCFSIAQEVRAAGFSAEVYLGGSGPKAQLKYADKRNAPLAIILGGDERANGQVTVKDLKLGAKLSAEAGDDREAYKQAQDRIQQTIPRADLIAAVRKALS
ncbi:MAG: histidine--tRNA ligase [Alphaproteobacteria bacterium]|nr:histidine--tRNA ligase [Alphaproteobacteria bacterium]